MKESEFERRPERNFRPVFREDFAVHPRVVDRRGFADRYSPDEFKRQDLRGRQVPMNDRHPDRPVLLEIMAEPVGVPALLVEIQLLADPFAEFLHDADRIVEFAFGNVLQQQVSQAQQDVHVVTDHGFDAGPLDFQRQLAAVARHRAVHLGDRGGGDGSFVKFR